MKGSGAAVPLLGGLEKACCDVLISATSSSLLLRSNACRVETKQMTAEHSCERRPVPKKRMLLDECINTSLKVNQCLTVIRRMLTLAAKATSTKCILDSNRKA